jgi:alpha-D-ribose 1-methylphosphonate 5-triphosphate diphosphatase
MRRDAPIRRRSGTVDMSMSETVFTNAKVVGPDEVFSGTVVTRNGLVADVSAGMSSIAAAVDLEGDYLVPGLVEIHTDNLEHNVMPRPAVMWPVAEAIIAHDAQMALSGVTTVFDALTVGGTQRNAFRAQLLPKTVVFLEEAIAQQRLRAEHFLHLRCEISAADMIERLEPVSEHALVELVSIMDHTPGQRQWIDVEKYRYRNKTRLGLSEAEADSLVRRKFEEQALYAGGNRAAVLNLLKQRPLPLASHDDTTAADIDDAVSMGATISEFPTTEVAAATARAKALSIVMGAPNIVLGGSHSGNVSASDLAARGHLDILSSDYVPASLVQACWMLHRTLSIPLHITIGMVTHKPARCVGFSDRGSIAVGQRADLVHIGVMSDRLPVVRAVWRAGQRIA